MWHLRNGGDGEANANKAGMTEGGKQLPMASRAKPAPETEATCARRLWPPRQGRRRSAARQPCNSRCRQPQPLQPSNVGGPLTSTHRRLAPHFGVILRLFPINSLGFSKFLENGRNSNYLLETHFTELLESGLQKRSFHQAGTKLKTKWKKQKSFLRAQKWRVGEEWKEELRDSKSRIPGVKCGCSCRTSHYVEE